MMIESRGWLSTSSDDNADGDLLVAFRNSAVPGFYKDLRMPTTSEEQYLLELVNEARLNPLGNALRYISSYSPLTSGDANIAQALSQYGVDGTALLAALRALPAVGALAWNDSLASAAEQHSAAMIAATEQSHQVAGEAPLATRVETAGYTGYSAVGENVYAYAYNLAYSHAAFMGDWGDGPNGMQ